jgi:hypothetical protein
MKAPSSESRIKKIIHHRLRFRIENNFSKSIGLWVWPGVPPPPIEA